VFLSGGGFRGRDVGVNAFFTRLGKDRRRENNCQGESNCKGLHFSIPLDLSSILP
jgi:hypothetical protein